jgi:hypothetical protein
MQLKYVNLVTKPTISILLCENRNLSIDRLVQRINPVRLTPFN